MQERLQKILSARGVASRRKAEEYIEAGLVKVNGRIAKIGDKADAAEDKIVVDGKVLSDRAEMLYYLMNKLVGVETINVEREGLHRSNTFEKGNRRNRGDRSGDSKRGTSVPSATSVASATSRSDGTRTVRDMLPPHLRGKIFPVGRLDKDSSGLLLFTNDGVLAYRLTHPSFNHEKEYEVTTQQPISPMVCRKIEEGFEMDGAKTKPLKCWKVATTRARVILTEGKNRQVRRMFQQTGYTVKGLRRVRIMTLADEKLKIGEIRTLTAAEKRALLGSVGLQQPKGN